jgi:poly-gamma-glutamate synthesis protein (capsule biosynthesis protein)
VFAAIAGLVIGLDSPARSAGDEIAIDRSAFADRAADRTDPPLRSLTVVATGDILTEASVRASAARAAPVGGRFDFVPMLQPIAPLISSADLAICHMELPIGWSGAPAGVVGTSTNGAKLSMAPFEITPALASTGFDRCSTASNHSYDRGPDGIASTIGALHRLGLSHVGTARSPSESVDRVFDVDGVRFGHLAVTRYVNTGLPRDAWRMNFVGDSTSVAADVADLRRRGAEIVLVSIHVGFELTNAPWPGDRTFVDRLTRSSDIDAIVMHGPHVVHPVEVVNATPVFWSVGNLVSGMGVPGNGRHSDPRALDGLIAVMQFDETATGDFASRHSAIGICNETWTRTVYAPSVHRPMVVATSDLARQLDRCSMRLRAVVPGVR